MAGMKSLYKKPLGSLDNLGGQLAFHIGVVRAIPRSITDVEGELPPEVVEESLFYRLFVPGPCGRFGGMIWR